MTAPAMATRPYKEQLANIAQELRAMGVLDVTIRVTVHGDDEGEDVHVSQRVPATDLGKRAPGLVLVRLCESAQKAAARKWGGP